GSGCSTRKGVAPSRCSATVPIFIGQRFIAPPRGHGIRTTSCWSCGGGHVGEGRRNEVQGHLRGDRGGQGGCPVASARPRRSPGFGAGRTDETPGRARPGR